MVNSCPRFFEEIWDKMDQGSVKKDSWHETMARQWIYKDYKEDNSQGHSVFNLRKEKNMQCLSQEEIQENIKAEWNGWGMYISTII